MTECRPNPRTSLADERPASAALAYDAEGVDVTDPAHFGRRAGKINRYPR